MFLKLFFIVVLINTTYILAFSSFSITKAGTMSGDSIQTQRKGEKLFKTNCSGCHLKGENLIKPDKPIIGSQKIKSKQLFELWLENPTPPMPNFKNITSKPNQLDALYNYVTSLK